LIEQLLVDVSVISPEKGKGDASRGEFEEALPDGRHESAFGGKAVAHREEEN